MTSSAQHTSPSLGEETTITVASTPTSSFLSTNAAQEATPSFASDIEIASDVTTSGASSVTGSLIAASVLSSSIEAALTSGGVPVPIATSLVPVVVGSATPASTSLSPEASASAVAAQQEEQKAIAEFIRWLLNFFHLE